MPINKGTTNYSSIYKGSTRISQIYIGTTLKYSGDRVINLGSGQSWNIKTLYPNLYNKLTVDNFFILTHNAVNGSRTETWPGYNIHLSIRNGLYKSYNASTGVLNMYYYASGSSENKANVTAVIVTNPSKSLIELTPSDNTYDMRSYSGYGNFTVNNFLISTIGEHYTCNESRTSAGTWTVNNTTSLDKSYSSGTLTCRETRTGDSAGTGNGSYYKVYLYQKGTYN